MRTFLFVIVLILISGIHHTAHAQLFDSIQNAFEYKPKPLAKLEARNAFVTSSYVKMKAVKAGLSFNDKVRLGVGYTWMKSDYLVPTPAESSELKFGYALGFFEYAFFQSKHWNLEIPLQFGYGRIAYKTQGNVLARQWVPVYEPAMTMEYLFLKYFGVGFGAGYRIIVKSKLPIKEQFTSPIYIFKFKVNFGNMYKDIKKQFND